MSTELAKSKYDHHRAFKVEEITGNEEFVNPFGDREIVVTPTLRSNSSDTPATEANKCVALSVEIAADRKTFKVYCWKPTAAGTTTLIAATDAVDVQIVVECVGA